MRSELHLKGERVLSNCGVMIGGESKITPGVCNRWTAGGLPTKKEGRKEGLCGNKAKPVFAFE